MLHSDRHVMDILGDSLPEGRYYFQAEIRLPEDTLRLPAGSVDLRRIPRTGGSLLGKDVSVQTDGLSDIGEPLLAPLNKGEAGWDVRMLVRTWGCPRTNVLRQFLEARFTIRAQGGASAGL